jgi:hypothetical protein
LTAPVRAIPVSVGLALVLVLAGCASSAPGTSRTVVVGADRVSAAQLASVIDGLCTTRREVPNVTAARTAFYDLAHENLHLLARAVEGHDRGAAARLLEAKQRVEADLISPGGPTLLATHVNALSRAARAALDLLEIPTSSCRKADEQ